MECVLNETTSTVHKHDPANDAPVSVCGATNHLNHDQLQLTTVRRATSHTNVSKCGRCFEDGGGY